MITKCKLLKDLLFLKAGTIVNYDNTINQYSVPGQLSLAYINLYENYTLDTEWFEPIEEESDDNENN